MAAVDQAPAAAPAGRRAGGRRDGFTPWRWLILILAGVYFFIPLYAAARFAGWGSFRAVVHQSGFADSLWLSVRLAAITTVITLALMLPPRSTCTCGCPGCGGCWKGSRSCRS